MSRAVNLGLQVRGNILFLLRTYNDIDHIVPVIWKAAIMGYTPFFLFVNDDYGDDYRIKFVVGAGAKALNCPIVQWYHRRIRRWLYPRQLRRLVDRSVAYTVGNRFLTRHKIVVLVNEWSGALGREMAEYFLRPAHRLRLRCVSFPHGYFIWSNDRINRHEAELWQQHKKRPDFTDRNCFSSYVVQNTEAQRFKINRGISSENIKVLGSARFCPEWSNMNFRLISAKCPKVPQDGALRLLFFVPDWNYNVDRKTCIALLERLATLSRVILVVKANTRGTGSFSDEEKSRFSGKANVQFPDLTQHSSCLIRQSDAVVNFASSIGIEALLQQTPVCNPLFLNGNGTIFDGSNVVFDAKDEEEVIKFVFLVRNGRYPEIAPEVWSEFHRRYVLGGSDNQDVLDDYLRMLSLDLIASKTSPVPTDF